MNKQQAKSAEIWRLLFSISIVLNHGQLLPWRPASYHVGNLGVEFFFILSGFLMAKSVWNKGPCENVGAETIRFLLKKLKSIYPCFLFALAVELFADCVLRTGENAISPVYLWDLLFVRAGGLGGTHQMAVGASWYLFVMIVGMWILYPLLRKYTDVFCHVIAPLVAVLVFGWFSAVHGNIGIAFHFERGICLGLLRGISEMCFGCACYAACQKLQAKGKPSAIWTVIEISAFTATLLIIRFCYRSQLDFVAIFLIGIGIIAAFSGRSYANAWLKAVNIKWISQFSLALYLNHYVWLRTLDNWNLPLSFQWQLKVYVGLAVVSAVTCMATLSVINHVIRPADRLKRLLCADTAESNVTWLTSKKICGKEERNLSAELWRMVFAVVIVMWHARKLPWAEGNFVLQSGVFVVEFFFILSGYLMAQSVCREGGTEKGEWQFLWQKIRSFYPAYLFALVFDIVVRLSPLYHREVDYKAFAYYIYDFLMLRATGIQGLEPNTVVGPSWYLSAMLVAMMILYPLLRRFRDVFFNILAPMLAIFLFGWFSVMKGSLDYPLVFENGICLGLLRAIAGISLGTVCFAVCRWVKTLGCTGRLWRCVVTAAEIVSFVGAIAVCVYKETSQTDFVGVFLFAVGIVAAFSGYSYSALALRRVNLRWVPAFSLALYLNHGIWLKVLLSWNLPCSYLWQTTIYVMLSVLTAVTAVATVNVFTKKINVRK